MSALFPTDPTDAASLDRLRGRLADDAAREGLLDVAYRQVDSPVGPLLLATTPRGLVRVAYSFEDLDGVVEDLAQRLSPRVLHAPARLDDAARQLEEYFSRARTRFDLAVDLTLSRGFRRTVLEYLRTIGYGETESYAEVAGHVGNPGAVRAVGSACATNPLPIVVPCHRVLRSDGTLGGYLGGLPAKELLLSLERAA
ncbi:methylated-DNA--[protein]-cysteine S-methyltransferase [Georgenia sp. H159]|uniref:methylated-DNA--[protein]-cysteine S-methyltransferase n=1 Tax=Georgenia sp. H159 TaxID=3076115 RepID=UPI002D7969A7|nr:methylated-DNA--[protein]-cysteine S-methyltransferase [Georgenia sp. H159]